MADEAFVTLDLSASVAQLAGFSVGGTSAKKGGDAMLRISRALHGLVTSLVSGLEEFQDVEAALLQETAAGIVNGSPGEPLVLACTLKEMVGTFVSVIKAHAEVQKLLPEMQKASDAHHHAIFQELMIPKNPSCATSSLPPGEEMPVCIPSKYLRMVKRAAGLKGQGLCRHFCDHHPEVVDPRVWRNLPQELVERVFAKMPLARIVQLRECSKAWYNMSKSSNFGEACSESHPKLFGLLGWDSYRMRTTLYDIKTKEWLSVPWAGFPGSANCGDWEPEADDDSQHAYRNSMYACDGGLVCFVPQKHLTSCPILVCNPLTSVWKSLPVTPVEDFINKKIIMVELVMEDDKKGYRVILVSRERSGGTFSAHCYKSETGVWSIMDSGLVYGTGSKLELGHRSPLVFNCTTRTLFDLRLCASLESLSYMECSVNKDRVYVLHETTVLGREREFLYLISEYTWDSSIADLRQLNVFESPVEVFPDPHSDWLFSSRDFVLFFLDVGDEGDEDHHKLVGLYDVSANRWDVPPWLANEWSLSEKLQRWFMCELRWDITP